MHALKTPSRTATERVSDDGAAQLTSPGRLVAIDILRGVAIVWVVLFHLWGDMEFFPGAPRGYYDRFIDQVGSAGAWPIVTAFSDLVFRLGFQGVPLFMMISGISLTIAAYRAEGGVRWGRFLFHRFRRLLMPYWVGVGITYIVIACIAWRQESLGWGGFTEQFTGGVTIARASIVNVDWNVAVASVTLLPRLTRAEWFFAPKLALWFVGLLAQYYLLFPLLLLVMKRTGVAAFLVVTFAVTVGANWWIVDQYGAPEFKFYLVTGWAPFRLFEFTSGMAIGWLLVAPDAKPWLGLARNPLAIVAALALGFSAHTGGDLLIGQWTVRYWQSLALPLSTLGLALLVLPLLVKPASRIDAWAPVRALTTVGVMSYAILIVNDPLRLVASQLRVEGVNDVAWWTFLVLYVPVSIALAWPLARLLGLIKSAPRERRAALMMQHEERLRSLATSQSSA